MLILGQFTEHHITGKYLSLEDMIAVCVFVGLFCYLCENCLFACEDTHCFKGLIEGEDSVLKLSYRFKFRSGLRIRVRHLVVIVWVRGWGVHYVNDGPREYRECLQILAADSSVSSSRSTF